MKQQTDTRLKFETFSNQKKIESSAGDTANKSVIQTITDPGGKEETTRLFFSSPCMLSEFEDEQNTFKP